MRRTFFQTLVVLAALGLALPTEAGRLYRWTDADGQVHYTDKIPPEQARQEHVELSDDGIAVGRTEAAKTAEEIERQRELERLRAEQQRLIEEQKAADRVLLRTFRSEDDIILARDGKLASVDVMIQVTRSNIKRYKLKLGEMQRNAANLERGGRQVSPNYLREIEATRLALKDAYATIIRAEQSKDKIREAAQKDLDRFLKLKNLKPSREADEAAQRAKELFFINVYDCSNDAACDAAWARVEDFVTRNATTRLQMLGDYIVMTGAATKDDDISITVSRIRNADGPGAKLFMDLQCKDSSLGAEFCASDRVAQIHQSFRPTMAGAAPHP